MLRASRKKYKRFNLEDHYQKQEDTQKKVIMGYCCKVSLWMSSEDLDEILDLVGSDESKYLLPNSLVRLLEDLRNICDDQDQVANEIYSIKGNWRWLWDNITSPDIKELKEMYEKLDTRVNILIDKINIVNSKRDMKISQW